MTRKPAGTADFETQIQCKDGRTVTITLDDDTSLMAKAYDVDGREIGSMEFYEVEIPHGNVLKLAWAFLDKLDGQYLHQGIGRQILKLVWERYRMPIIAEDDDGIQKDDGSHLTGDAPAFIARMREEGLIERSEQNDDDDPQDE